MTCAPADQRHRLRLHVLFPTVCGTHVHRELPLQSAKGASGGGDGQVSGSMVGCSKRLTSVSSSSKPCQALCWPGPEARRTPAQIDVCLRSMKGWRRDHPSGGDIGRTISLRHESHSNVADGLGRCQGHVRTIASCSGRLTTGSVPGCGLMRWSGGTRGAGGRVSGTHLHQ